jgi:hypothetical protein
MEWFFSTIKKIGFEDVKTAIERPEKYIIINTLLPQEQFCLIKNTTSIDIEEKIINELLDNYDYKKYIIIYGKNSVDASSEKNIIN